jgi:hypothetical protein
MTSPKTTTRSAEEHIADALRSKPVPAPAVDHKHLYAVRHSKCASLREKVHWANARLSVLRRLINREAPQLASGFTRIS